MSKAIGMKPGPGSLEICRYTYNINNEQDRMDVIDGTAHARAVRDKLLEEYKDAHF